MSPRAIRSYWKLKKEKPGLASIQPDVKEICKYCGGVWEVSSGWAWGLLRKQQGFCGHHSRCASAGERTCSFKAQGVLWELYQVVNVSLEAAHLLDQLSVFCTSSSGFQLSCCVPNTSLTYMATWSSGEDSEGERGCPVQG